jgi:hypothetical protein
LLIALIIISLCSGAVSGINLWASLSIKHKFLKHIQEIERKAASQRSGRTLSPDSNRARVLSRDERRDLIAARAFEQQPVVRTSGLIPPDREAQTHLNDWQARVKKS